MKLYFSPTSPYARKVMVLLHEAGKTDAVELLPCHPTPLQAPEGLPAHNPLGKLPALVRDEGPALFDSRVICAYLDDRLGTGLYPERRVWETRTLEALGDGILDAALLMTYEGRLRPEDHRWPDWVEGQWSKIARACTNLERQWISHLKGPLDMGQIAVGCALGYVDFRHGARDWRGANPQLAEWYQAFAARPSMETTRPPEGA